jgi:pimeloyl-ACP methyl ester carboxylesterase
LKSAHAGAAETAAQGLWMPQHAFEAQASACMTHDTAADVHKIRVPVLLTVGSADIFTPMAYSEYLHARIAGSALKVFTGWGHVHHWEALEEFNSSTTEWLVEN